MYLSINLSAESVKLLQVRGLSNEQVNDFSDLLNKANSQLDEQASAKQVLAGMSSQELELLRKATSLADPIKIDSLSTEGAINLLAQPDKTGMVDLNNDGLVEVGAARMMTFPPVNAPANVHQAWQDATEGMSMVDKMSIELRMHHLVYGFNIIEGQPTKPILAPEAQWSMAGWQKLLADARSALEFSVSMDGWTRHHLLEQGVYDRFDEALSNMGTQ